MATATNLAENMSVNTSQAAFPDLHDLVHLFYDDVGELASFANQLGGTLPGPFDALLDHNHHMTCLLYTSPSPRDATLSRMPSSA